MSELGKTCALCSGTLVAGTTTFTVDFGAGVVVVRHAPAEICDQCGEAWVDDTTAAKLESLVVEAKAESKQFEVVDLAA